MIQLRKSNYVNDKSFEQITNDWLMAHGAYETLNISEIVTDGIRQKQGIDCISHTYGNIDLKAIAGTIPTFSFEAIGNQRSKKNRTGIRLAF